MQLIQCYEINKETKPTFLSEVFPSRIMLGQYLQMSHSSPSPSVTTSPVMIILSSHALNIETACSESPLRTWDMAILTNLMGERLMFQ
jgi:hypothetical protein